MPQRVRPKMHKRLNRILCGVRKKISAAPLFVKSRPVKMRNSVWPKKLQKLPKLLRP
jgi:hypothetical protein